MADYNFMMDSRLRPEQLKVVNQLGRLAAAQGLNVYLAGGAVRDLLLALTGARSLTFVVEGNIQRIVKPLTSRAVQRPRPAASAGSNNEVSLRVTSLSVDSKQNEAHVVFEGGVKADIATSRNEVYGALGKAPEVTPGTIFDDLRRRDFSIDAMAISLHPNSRGLLLDPTNGAADIERKELRALHSRSFFDEPARIYRLLRLGLRFDFKPDEKTERWLGLALEERVWEHLSEEQQGRELRAILGEEHAGKLLKLLHDRELLAGLDRKLASARIEFDKFERIRSAIRTAGATDDAILLNFLALVAKMPAAEQNRLAKKILKEAKVIKRALGLEREAAQLAKALGSPKISKPSQIHSLLTSAPTDQVIFLLVHDSRPAIQNRVKAFFTKYPAIRAALPRAELESLGLPPGPQFEKVMNQIFLDELDGKIKNPQHMTKLLMDYAGIKPAPPAPPPPPPKAAPKSTAGKAAAPKAAPKPAAAMPAAVASARPSAPPGSGAARPGAAPPAQAKTEPKQPAAAPAKSTGEVKATTAIAAKSQAHVRPQPARKGSASAKSTAARAHHTPPAKAKSASPRKAGASSRAAKRR